MRKNIKNRSEFNRQVAILWAHDYEELELEEFPCSLMGGFYPARIDALLKLARIYPEYHIVTCIQPDLYVNAFVKGGQAYYLAEGYTDPNLIHDPYDQLDAYLLYSLNSGRKSRSA